MKMPIDLWSLYALMLKSRLFEEAVTQLWKDGLISGEMHLGTGEEAIIAGVVAHLGVHDAMTPWRLSIVEPQLCLCAV